MQVINGQDFKNMLLVAAECLTEEKDRLNALNVFPVPDGDTGTNMALTMSAAVRECSSGEPEKLGKVALSVARGSLMGARGNSGVILSQFFRGLGDGLAKLEAASGTDLAQALSLASVTTYRAVMKPVEGTMLSVGKAAAEAALEKAQAGGGPDEVLEAALVEAQRSLADTPNQLPVLKQAGVVDAGAQGLVLLLQGSLAGLRGDAHPGHLNGALQTTSGNGQSDVFQAIKPTVGVLENKYCTEFVLQGEQLDVQTLRRDLEPQGDSLLVVGDSEIVKVHVHTDHPGTVLELCGAKGSLLDIKIDNMEAQNSEAAAPGTGASTGLSDGTLPAEKELGLVAVVSGSELGEIFLSLGADTIVFGGQSMNPSTEELAAAVRGVKADQVLVLPNNKNVIFSAQQVRELVDKTIGVVSTRSIPQGIAAMLGFNEDISMADNITAMEEQRVQVKTGEVTYAVRSTRAGDLQIEEQDIIGLAEGSITVVGKSVDDVTVELLEQIVEDDSEVISLYSGSEQDFEQAQWFTERLQDRFDHCEIELYKGGQPLYYYIISVE